MNQHVFLIDKDFFFGGGFGLPNSFPRKAKRRNQEFSPIKRNMFCSLAGVLSFLKRGDMHWCNYLSFACTKSKKQLSCNVGPGNHPATLLNPGNVVPSKNWLPTYLYKINPSHATPWCNQNTRFLCLRLAPFTTCHPNVWLESLINTTRTRAAGKGRSLVGQWLLYNW